MSDLNKKLLAEAFDAFVSENDIAKATRLFQRHWNLVAKNNFALLESEDADFDIEGMGDDFNQDIMDEAGSDKDQKFEQLQIAVDELEDKYPVEMTEEIQAKFDDLRNAIDEMKLAEEGEVSDEDATVIVEDLKADFEVAGEIAEDVEALFDEISAGLQGEEVSEEEAEDEDVEATEEEVSEEEIVDEEPLVEEGVEEDDEEEVDLDFDEEAEDMEPAEEAGEEAEEEAEEEPVESAEEAADEEEIIYDAKEKAEDLLAKLEELEAMEEDEHEDIEDDELKEGWEKAKLPRNKLQSEEEGVKKQGMKFAKSSSIPARKGMGVSSTVSAGVSADKKVKVNKIENKGAKSWTKVAKAK